jgi:hypothetical protein
MWAHYMKVDHQPNSYLLFLRKIDIVSPRSFVTISIVYDQEPQLVNKEDIAGRIPITILCPFERASSEAFTHLSRVFRVS